MVVCDDVLEGRTVLVDDCCDWLLCSSSSSSSLSPLMFTNASLLTMFSQFHTDLTVSVVGGGAVILQLLVKPGTLP